MTEEDDDTIVNLPDSDPIPEILIVESSDGRAASDQLSNEEEEVINEEEEIIDEEFANFSSIPFSTPNLEEEFLHPNPDTKKQINKTPPSSQKNRSNCCILI